MPIEVDTSKAPAFLRYRYYGGFPSVEEQSRVREKLIALGMLNADTLAIMDARELTDIPDDDFLRAPWPRRSRKAGGRGAAPT